MDVKDFIAPFAVWKRAFEKPFTVKKPIDERPGAPRYRGFHKNDAEACVGCGSCEAICQNAAIDLVEVAGRSPSAGDSGLRPRIDYGRCCWCALCVDICPSGSLTMSNEYVWIDSDPEAFRFVPGVDKKPWDHAELGYKRAEGYSILDRERVEMPELPHAEGVASFRELVKGYSRELAEREADRCVECGLCVASCPAHMDIPGYIRAVREGKIDEGLRLLYETNPFPEACGRVCTHVCEEACSIGVQGDPLAIRWLKRYIADQVELSDYAKELPRKDAPTGKKVAVIGAGPGGLAAAYYLAMAGHEVRVLEAAPKAGGMLRYGIPEYRLPYEALDKDIGYIESLGVTVETSVAVGKDFDYAKLKREHDAVYVSTGLPAAYKLDVSGDDLPCVRDGVEVLAQVTRGEDPKLGKKVAVVGGGNVAMDCARTARRLGAEVDILYRRREVDMPADPEEIVESKAEGVNIVVQAIPTGVKLGPGGSALVSWGQARMVDQGPGKRPLPELMSETVREVRYDTIVAAIGQGPDLSFIGADAADGLEIKRYKPVVDATGRTGDPKVWAGGDLVNEKKDAISAIADGHRAALAIDRALRKGA